MIRPNISWSTHPPASRFADPSRRPARPDAGPRRGSGTGKPANRLVDLTDRHNRISVDREIAVSRRMAGAVDDQPVSDHHVVSHLFCRIFSGEIDCLFYELELILDHSPDSRFEQPTQRNPNPIYLLAIFEKQIRR